MDITLRIKDVGDAKLYLQPVDEINNSEDSRGYKFILVRCQEDFTNPYMTLQIDKNGTLEIINQRDIEEDKEFLKEKLDDFSLGIVEALRQGVDLSAVNIPETVVKIRPYDPELIRVEPNNISLREAFTMITNGEINLSPDFQRNVVWDNGRKSRLI